MIVRDRGDDWQVVLQYEHAAMAEEVARAWADCGPRHDSVVLAARRHDDGWAVWERCPLVDGEGKPMPFLDVNVLSHLAFYRAVISAVTDEDPYAGLLVAMHGAGIYRLRYGSGEGPALNRAADAQALVDAFVEEQEASYPDRMTAAGVDDDLRWADYYRGQWYDRISLAFCMRDWDAPTESVEVGEFTIEPLGPWRARVTPYPLIEPSMRFGLVRRLVPKRPWTQAEFREAFWSFPAERVEIMLEA